jgi:hypothetical protein
VVGCTFVRTCMYSFCVEENGACPMCVMFCSKFVYFVIACRTPCYVVVPILVLFFFSWKMMQNCFEVRRIDSFCLFGVSRDPLAQHQVKKKNAPFFSRFNCIPKRKTHTQHIASFYTNKTSQKT